MTRKYERLSNLVKDVVILLAPAVSPVSLYTLDPLARTVPRSDLRYSFMGILVEPYDELWPTQFESLKQNYEDALVRVPLVSIEHVGSTSVPALWAKPIIDIDIVVESQHYQDAISAMASYGYTSRGELGIEGRWAFEAANAPHKTNTYVVCLDSLALKNHLAVRDVLRRNPEFRDEYSAVKRDLAIKTSDIDIYISGKTEVLQRVLKLGGLSDEELAEIAAVNRN